MYIARITKKFSQYLHTGNGSWANKIVLFVRCKSLILSKIRERDTNRRGVLSYPVLLMILLSEAYTVGGGDVDGNNNDEDNTPTEQTDSTWQNKSASQQWRYGRDTKYFFF